MKITYNPDSCEIQNNGNIKCKKGLVYLKTSKGLEELEIEINGKKPNDGVINFNNGKISYKGIVLNNMEYEMDINGNKTSKVYEPSVPSSKSYIGYYADVDGNGTPDGVIYADLAHSKSGEWGTSNHEPTPYSYTAKTKLKKYIISDKKYNGVFGEKEVISLKNGNIGEEKFYVMALEDFTTSDYATFYWYKNAFGKMSTYEEDTSTAFGTGYANTGKIIEIWNENGQEEGSYVGATQDNQDIWKYIQTKYNEGWYMPSLGEWRAFADYLAHKEGNQLTGKNAQLYNIYHYYWTSSQKSKYYVFYIDFLNLIVVRDNVSYNFPSVRLSKIF